MLDEVNCCNRTEGAAGMTWIAGYGRAVTEASLKHLIEHRNELEAMACVPKRAPQAAE